MFHVCFFFICFHVVLLCFFYSAPSTRARARCRAPTIAACRIGATLSDTLTRNHLKSPSRGCCCCCCRLFVLFIVASEVLSDQGHI